jgi:hypothetical protein
LGKVCENTKNGVINNSNAKATLVPRGVFFMKCIVVPPSIFSESIYYKTEQAEYPVEP